MRARGCGTAAYSTNRIWTFSRPGLVQSEYLAWKRWWTATRVALSVTWLTVWS